MAQYDAIFKCSYGGASLQLVDYSVAEEGILSSTGKRTNTRVKFAGRGYVEASSETDYETKLAAVRAAFEQSGLDLVVYGLSGKKEYECLAAQCVFGQPVVERMQFMEQGASAPLVKQISFAITATKLVLTPGGTPSETYEVTTAVRPDRLREITYSGQVIGIDAVTHFQTSLAARFAQYGLQPTSPGAQTMEVKWVPEYEQTVNDTGELLRYRVRFTELKVGISEARVDLGIVNAELNIASDRDEQMRKVETWTYDVLSTGSDVGQMMTELRPTAAALQGGLIVRESFQYTNYHELRLQATFNILRGGDGNELLEWNQVVTIDGTEAAILDPVEYEGLRTVLLLKRFPVQRARQSGRAIGLAKYPKAPDPIFGNVNYSANPRIERRVINQFELETTWSYEFVFNSNVPTVTLAQLTRPAAPEFYT